MTGYNGWTNYATWRVNLELFSDMDPREMEWQFEDEHDLARLLNDYVDELLRESARDGLALDYAMAFLTDVNFREIAGLMIEWIEADKAETETEDA